MDSSQRPAALVSRAMRTHDLARARACTTDTLIPVCLTGLRFSYFIMIYDRVL